MSWTFSTQLVAAKTHVFKRLQIKLLARFQ
jgi:hypothetical protein